VRQLPSAEASHGPHPLSRLLPAVLARAEGLPEKVESASLKCFEAVGVRGSFSGPGGGEWCESFPDGSHTSMSIDER